MKKESKTNKSFSDFPIFKIPKSEFENHPLLAPLLEISQCPEQIYYRGTLPQNPKHLLSIVGSRAITSYGKDALNKIFENLSPHPISIISGLALGVDALSHQLALKHNLPTIAIPGSGISEKALYPKTNQDLALQILNSGGVILSEFEPEYRAQVWTFPARNRIMAALSHKVLLVEAGEKSGTLITARLALEYNKDVLCIPGSIFSSRSAGTNKLIQEGAGMILESNDVLKEFRIAVSDEQTNTKEISLDGFEKKIYTFLEIPKTKDEILEFLKIDTSEFLMHLTMLELKNLVQIEGSVIKKKIN